MWLKAAVPSSGRRAICGVQEPLPEEVAVFHKSVLFLAFNTLNAVGHLLGTWPCMGRWGEGVDLGLNSWSLWGIGFEDFRVGFESKPGHLDSLLL